MKCNVLDLAYSGHGKEVMNIAQLIIIAVVSSAIFVGCGPKPLDECEADTACSDGRICVEGACVSESEDLTPKLELSTERLDFERWTTETNSVESLTLSNIGDASLVVERVELIGDDKGDFRIESDGDELVDFTIEPDADPVEIRISYTGGLRTGA
ncbi:MAG: hypothetical protein ACQEVA_19395, partial [Myxococcota bacterium]